MNRPTLILITIVISASMASADGPQPFDALRQTPLHAAVADGDSARVAELLKAGADPRALDAKGRSPLSMAVASHAEELCEAFLMAMPAIDLETAVRNGDADLVACRLIGDPDYGRPRPQWRPRVDPLGLAESCNRPEMIRVLIANGWPVDDSFSPFQTACAEGRADIVKAFIDGGVNVNLPGDAYWYSPPLNRAAAAGHLEIVNMLLAAGAKPDFTGEGDWPALHAAAFNGKVEVVRRLLDARADIEKATKYGWRPLHSALWGDESGQAAALLLQRGAKLDAFAAAALGRSLDMLALMESGLPGEFQKSVAQHPLHWAARRGQMDVVRLLLARGVKVDLSDEYSNTPLKAAVGANQREMTRFLIGQGADPLIRFRYDQTDDATLLHMAARMGHLEMCRDLIAAGIDVNALAEGRYTPLSLAIRGNHLEIIDLLIGKGAKLAVPAVPGSESGKPQSVIEGPGFWGARPATIAHMVKLGFRLLDEDGKLSGGPHEWTRGPEWIDFLVEQDLPIKEIGGQLLYAAVSYGGREDVALKLIELGVDVNSRGGGDGESILDKAIENASLRVVRALIAAGAKPNPARNDHTILHAGRLGDVQVFRYLQNQGLKATTGQQSRLNWNGISSAYQAAVEYNNKEMVRFLVDQGCDAQKAGRDGESPLTWAASAGAKLAALALIEAGADPDGKDRYGRAGGPLRSAIERGHVATMRMLLEHGATWPDKSGRSVLATAAEHQKIEMIRALAAAGVDINTPDGRCDALFAAVGHPETVKALLDLGADAKAVDENGHDVLFRAVNHYSPNLDVIRLLLKAGADPNREGGRLLHGPVIKVQDDLVKLLLANGAKTDLFAASALGHMDVVMVELAEFRDAADRPQEPLGGPLHWAAFGGQDKIVELLIQGGADVDASCGQSKTPPMFWAAANGNLATIRLLIRSKAQVNGPQGLRAPLRAAAANGHADAVRLLLDSGADPDHHPGENGWTALHLAQQAGSVECVRLLLNAGADVNAVATCGGQKMTALEMALSVTHYGGDWISGRKIRPANFEDACMEIAEMLVEQSADLKAGGPISIHAAANRGRYLLVRMMLDRGLSVEGSETGIGRRHQSPLMMALSGYASAAWRGRHSQKDWDPVNNDHFRTIKLLLERGANPRAAMETGRPNFTYDVAYLARETNCQEIIDLVNDYASGRKKSAAVPTPPAGP